MTTPQEPSLLTRIRNVFRLCAHKWELIDQYSIHSTISGNRKGTLYVMHCAHCGEIKQRRVS